jgi:hypothetical protein
MHRAQDLSRRDHSSTVERRSVLPVACKFAEDVIEEFDLLARGTASTRIASFARWRARTTRLRFARRPSPLAIRGEALPWCDRGSRSGLE